jgi:VanZ family protein
MAWLFLSAIVVLTVVPAGSRPATFVPHNIEHAAIFLAAGILFGTAYLGREWLLSIGAIVFCAAIELAQLYVPGRHARLGDFVIDAAAAVLGVFLGRILFRTFFARPVRRRANVGMAQARIIDLFRANEAQEQQRQCSRVESSKSKL